LTKPNQGFFTNWQSPYFHLWTTCY